MDHSSPLQKAKMFFCAPPSLRLRRAISFTCSILARFFLSVSRFWRAFLLLNQGDKRRLSSQLNYIRAQNRTFLSQLPERTWRVTCDLTYALFVLKAYPLGFKILRTRVFPSNNWQKWGNWNIATLTSISSVIVSAIANVILNSLLCLL